MRSSITSGNPAVTISLQYPKSLYQQIANSVFSGLVSNQKAIPDIQYRIVFKDGKYLLFRNNRQTHLNRSINKIIYALEWQVVADILNNFKTELKFHAASLTFQQKGYLFIGNSGTGKTSLSITLMRQGWQLLSDEFGILNPVSFEVYPFPRNILIKPHHPISQMEKENYLSIRLKTNHKTSTIYYFPPSYFGQTGAKQVPLKKIFFLHPVASESYKIKAMGQRETIENLLRSISNSNLIKVNFEQFVTNFLKRVKVYELFLPNPFNLPAKVLQKLSSQLVQENPRC
jgi:hypothetical protein